jgi:hypothetical protein
VANSAEGVELFKLEEHKNNLGICQIAYFFAFGCSNWTIMNSVGGFIRLSITMRLIPLALGLFLSRVEGIGRILLDIYQLLLPMMTFKLMRTIHAWIFFLPFSLMVLVDRIL